MRAILLVAGVLVAAGACIDGGDAALVSADSTAGAAAPGCVVPEAPPRGTPLSWKVREGDSLRRIAAKVYGDERLWKAIRDANPGKVGAGDVIVPGTVLEVPRDGI